MFKRFNFHSVFLPLITASALSACGGTTDTADNSAAPEATAAAKQQVLAKAAGGNYEQAAQALYIAYFGRPADQAGLVNLEQQLAAANAPANIPALDSAYGSSAKVKQLIDQLGTTTESTRIYGMGSGMQLVNAAFQTVLQRAPAQSEASNWLNTLNTAGYSHTRLPLDVMASALNGQGTDTQAVTNRIAFATTFTEQLTQRGATTYAGISALAAARHTLARIDHSTTAALQGNQLEAAIGAVSPASVQKALVRKAASTPANTFFVSPSGNNANPGTQASPWKTLQYAVSKLSAGQTLYAMSGTYTETVTVNASGTAAAPITIAAYTGQSPIIDGATVTVGAYASLLKLHGSYINVSGFEIRNINVDGHGGKGGSATITGGFGVSIEGNNDTVSNLNIHNTWSQGILASGNNSVIEYNTVSYVAMSNCRAANTANCSSTPRGWASCLSAASPYGSGLITFNAIIKGNTVFNCWGEGISTWLSNGTTIEDNVTYNNWAQNLYVNNAWNTLVQRNIVYNTPNNYVGKTASFTLADEVTSTTNNPISGFPTVINNLLYNADLCAFCWTNVAGTGLYGGLIANNTINSPGLPSGITAFATGGSGNSKNVTNVYSFIYNNIVVGGGYVPSLGGLTLSNNLWSTKPATGAANGAGDVIGNPQLAASGSTSAGQLTAKYFQLQASSPAIAKGKVLTTVTSDFAGTSMGAPPAIGGYQAPL